MSGSTLVIVASSKEEVLQTLREDVYAKSGVWDVDKVCFSCIFLSRCSLLYSFDHMLHRHTRVRMSANERGSPDSDVASQVCFQNPREAVDTEHVISKHSPNDGLGLGLASFAVASAQSDIAVSNMFLSILILALWHPYPVLLAPRACRSSSVVRLSLCQ